MFDDTIAAVSTPFGKGGIGIIRISGENAFLICERIYKGKKSFKDIKTHTINYGYIEDPVTKKKIDEVMITKMNAPKTYTCEDTVEINCHGGLVQTREILDAVITAGARPAQPGEFTKRAFLNGRLDLTQAEAVIDIINSSTKKSSQAALNQLEGTLFEFFDKIEKKLINEMAKIEYTIDYPEHNEEKQTKETIIKNINIIKNDLKSLLSTFNRGRVLREGLKIVLAGRPNAGKSSLLNTMAGKNRAIVSKTPGTTRDVLDIMIDIKGIPVILIDTAGLRSAKNTVEKEGVKRAEKEIEKADLTVLLIDPLQKMDKKEESILKKTDKNNILILINKIDKANEEQINYVKEKVKGYAFMEISALKGTGIESFSNYIYEKAMEGKYDDNDEMLLTNARHKDLIEKTLLSLDNAKKSMEEGTTLDLAAIDMMEAVKNIGEITGSNVSDLIIDEIFKTFCIGK